MSIADQIDGISTAGDKSVEERLADVEAELARLSGLMAQFVELVAGIKEQVGPTLESLSKSPLMKMIGG